MKKLNFSFPIVRDIESTRERHQTRMDKLVCAGEHETLFLDEYDDDDLYEAITYQNRILIYYFDKNYWSGQRGVKKIKTMVNNHVRMMIIDYLIDNFMSKSWDTAYYLLHQAKIDKKMKRVSKIIYETLT